MEVRSGGVGGRHGWRDGHLLVGELEPLSDGLYVFCGVVGGWRGAGVRSEVGSRVVSEKNDFV